MTEWPRRHRITVEEYHRMAEVGLLASDARVELIEGEIIDMPPIGSRHAAVVDRLNHLLVRAVGERAIVRVHGPVCLDDYSEPQPDFALLVPREHYDEAHPRPGDTLLIVEVSETTLRYDREEKMPLYARHGVPEVWIVDVEGKQLHVFRQPSAASYRESLTLDPPGLVSVTALAGVTVDLSQLMR